MNLLYVIHLYLELKVLLTPFLWSRLDSLCLQAGRSVHARTVFIGGKAAPGYKMAKDILQFINCVAKGETCHYTRIVVLPLHTYRGLAIAHVSWSCHDVYALALFCSDQQRSGDQPPPEVSLLDQLRRLRWE